MFYFFFFFFQAEDGIRDVAVTGVQTCALPISPRPHGPLLCIGELEEPLALDRRAVDLEGPALVPRERDLGAVRRQIDAAPYVVDVGRPDQVFDRDATESLAERARLESGGRRNDIGRRVGDGRRRPVGRGGPPVLGERLWSWLLFARRRGRRRRGGRSGGSGRSARAVPGDRAGDEHRTFRALLDLTRRARHHQRFRTHRRRANGGVFLGDDDVVVVHLVLEAPLVRAVPR